MRIDAVTLFPELVSAVIGCGVTGRAAERGLLELVTWNPRDDAADRHRTVDDRSYGGGPGMVMAVEPLRTTLHRARRADPRPAPGLPHTPPGERLDQGRVAELARQPRLILLCSRYEGVDERLLASEVDAELSIGDFVVSGGELPAMTVIDAVARLLPGALGRAESAEFDSFATGVLDHPHYTRPEDVDGLRVPPVLLGGDHAAIARWRRKQALGRTWLRRPTLLAGRELDAEARQLLREFIDETRNDRGEPV